MYSIFKIYLKSYLKSYLKIYLNVAWKRVMETNVYIWMYIICISAGIHSVRLLHETFEVLHDRNIIVILQILKIYKVLTSIERSDITMTLFKRWNNAVCRQQTAGVSV